MQFPVTFLYPWLLLLVVAVVPLLWLQRRRQSAIGHSGIGMHKNLRSVPIVGRLPAIFFSLAFVAMIAALARPVIPEVSENRTVETRDICIAVDISGSMSGALPPPTQPANAPTTTSPTPTNGTTGTSSPQTYRRLDAARDAVVAFVAARPDDRLAVLVFDDQSYFYWPLSDDHKVLMKKAQLINSYTGGGTNFEGPSESNRGVGPFQACIDHFREYGQAKTKVIVLVTDGEDNISPKRQQEIAAMMEQVGVKLYVLGVGEGWTKADSMPVLGQFADKVGGKVYRVGDQGAMQQSFADINALEKSAISIEKNTSYLDIFQYFLMAALVLLALFLGSVVVTREDA